MKRRKQITKTLIKKRFRLAPQPTFAGLKALFRKVGLIDDQDRPTEEGRQALKG